MKVSARNNKYRNTKVIAKKPLTNLYEMNSKLFAKVSNGLQYLPLAGK